MVKYYWEGEKSCGSFHATSDVEARRKKAELAKRMKLLIVYRERDDTPDGTPFVEV